MSCHHMKIMEDRQKYVSAMYTADWGKNKDDIVFLAYKHILTPSKT